jgi:hypothetical protein
VRTLQSRFRVVAMVVGLTVATGGSTLLTSSPALAATGSVFPHVTCALIDRGLIQCTWAGSMSGWNRGNLKITISAKFNGNQVQSPTSKTCTSSTSCSIGPYTRNFSAVSGAMTVTVKGSGPGGSVTRSATSSA